MDDIRCLYNKVVIPCRDPAKVYYNSSVLYSGSSFLGTQKSNRKCHDVEVLILDVNQRSCSLSGMLKISLDPPEDTVTHFFEAELVGRRHSFLTRKWDADEDTDRRHWGKFPAFAELVPDPQRAFETDSFDYAAVEAAGFVFMRWKELFAVGAGTVPAAIAGFYYVCCHRTNGALEGFYFDRGSEMYQTLSLKHKRPRSSGIFESI